MWTLRTCFRSIPRHRLHPKAVQFPTRRIRFPCSWDPPHLLATTSTVYISSACKSESRTILYCRKSLNICYNILCMRLGIGRRRAFSTRSIQLLLILLTILLPIQVILNAILRVIIRVILQALIQVPIMVIIQVPIMVIIRVLTKEFQSHLESGSTVSSQCRE